MTEPFRPVLLEEGAPLVFPDPRDADAEGLLAIGADLSIERLLFAYENGIFPWYDEGYAPCWWSPDPRCHITAETLHVSRSLAKQIRRGGFELSWNRAFSQVMIECGASRPEGTWIFQDMVDAYTHLHRLGLAHSLEVWRGEDLVGGIYGVQRGALFAAESMFHRERDMSKVALAAMVRTLFRAGTAWFDVQFHTGHLGSMGAEEVSRATYLASLPELTAQAVDLRSLVPSL